MLSKELLFEKKNGFPWNGKNKKRDRDGKIPDLSFEVVNKFERLFK